MNAPRRIPALLSILLCTAGSAAAQTQADPSGVVTGYVIDAATGAPLSNAVIALEAAGDVTVVQSNGSGAFVSRGSSTVTGVDGSYKFSGLPPGAYRVHVRHMGYREAVLDVDLAQTSPFRVSVGLVLTPIRLEPMGVETAAAQPFNRAPTMLEEARTGRIQAETFRQQNFLESDARVLTQADVTEAVTLGEGDLLRALQRLPGVSSRDDYTAGFWTRGATWGQTRAYYDGLPLFNPIHAFGLLSSLNPDAVGVASFHPGVRSASIGEGAAGVLSMTSRMADRPGVHALSELSVTSARATVDLRSRNGMGGLVLGARRSYVDAATRIAQLAGGDSATYIPYSFIDLTARGDLRLSGTTGIEASGLWAEDDVHGEVRNLLRQTEGHWGNRVGQVAFNHGFSGLRSRTSVGVSQFNALINPPAPVGASAIDVVAAPSFVPAVHGSTRNALTVLTTSTEISQASGSRRPDWTLGAQFLGYWQSFGGQYPRPYPVPVYPTDTLFMHPSRLIPLVWGEHRWNAGSQFALETGVRVEFPQRTLNAPGAAVAPRVTARYTVPGGHVTVSASAGRSWQYTQALAPAGPVVGPDLYFTDVWLLANDTTPAIRADIATVGGEISFGAGWVGSATGYVRHSTGVAVPDPSPGKLDNSRAPSRPIFLSAINQARGVELGIRRIAGRMTTSLSYALAKSTMQAGGWTFASPADRRHTIDATAMYRLGPAIRFGAAMTASTGSPFTRFDLADSLIQNQKVADSIESPMAARTPMYASLDLLLDWEGRLGRAQVGAFLQVRNVLNRANAVTYAGSVTPCAPAPPGSVEGRAGWCDRFERGIPLLPLAGVRIAF